MNILDNMIYLLKVVQIPAFYGPAKITVECRVPVLVPAAVDLKADNDNNP